MAWVSVKQLTWYQRLMAKVLKTGPIPRSFSFLIDGNRTWGKVNKLVDESECHYIGFSKLKSSVSLLVALGVEEISVFCSTINNFKREQVAFYKMINAFKRAILLSINDELDEYVRLGVKIRFPGEISLLPKDFQKLAARIETATKDGKWVLLNFLFAHASRQEITNSIKKNLQAVQDKMIKLDEINEDLIEVGLQSFSSIPLDIYVRTSNISRSSDYREWISTAAVRYCMTMLGPDFEPFDCMKTIFYYQRCMYNKEFAAWKEEHNKRNYDEKTQEMRDFWEKQELELLEKRLVEFKDIDEQRQII